MLFVGCMIAVETFDLINSSSQCKSLLARMENLSIQSESEFLGYWYLWQYNTIQYNTNIVIDICDNTIQYNGIQILQLISVKIQYNTTEYKYCNS